MATMTLVQYAKLQPDLVLRGVIEAIIEINQMFAAMPFMGINNITLTYKRENTLGDVEVIGIGDQINAKNPPTYTEVSSSLTTIIGDAYNNNLLLSTDGGGDSLRDSSIVSKSKNAGRKYASMMINGTGASNEFPGLINLVAPGQQVDTGPDGSPITFGLLDKMFSMVIDKDGQVDWALLNQRTIDSILELYRTQPGAGIVETRNLPNAGDVVFYRGVPLYRNDFNPINQTKGSSTDTTTVFAGTWDQGSRENGIVGLVSEQNSGVSVREVGHAENEDSLIDRVTFYAGLANFSDKGLAAIPGITN